MLSLRHCRCSSSWYSPSSQSQIRTTSIKTSWKTGCNQKLGMEKLVTKNRSVVTLLNWQGEKNGSNHHAQHHEVAPRKQHTHNSSNNICYQTITLFNTTLSVLLSTFLLWNYYFLSVFVKFVFFYYIRRKYVIFWKGTEGKTKVLDLKWCIY